VVAGDYYRTVVSIEFILTVNPLYIT